jgi:hypothetical protein
MPGDAGAVRPLQHGPRGHLGPVVADDHPRLATPGDERVQLAHEPLAADRGVDHERQGLAGEVVDDAEDPEAAAPAQGVGHEVQAPAPVRAVWQRHRCACAGRALAAAPAAHCQALLAVEPPEFLLVHRHALALKQDAEPPVAEAAAFHR